MSAKGQQREGWGHKWNDLKCAVDCGVAIALDSILPQTALKRFVAVICLFSCHPLCSMSTIVHSMVTYDAV